MPTQSAGCAVTQGHGEPEQYKRPDETSLHHNVRPQGNLGGGGGGLCV